MSETSTNTKTTKFRKPVSAERSTHLLAGGNFQPGILAITVAKIE